VFHTVNTEYHPHNVHETHLEVLSELKTEQNV